MSPLTNCVARRAPQHVGQGDCTAKSGDPFVVEVAELSDTLPGTPDQLTLSSLLPAGTAPPAYTDYAFAFEQKITLDQKPGNFLRSDLVTVVRGQLNKRLR